MLVGVCVKMIQLFCRFISRYIFFFFREKRRARAKPFSAGGSIPAQSVISTWKRSRLDAWSTSRETGLFVVVYPLLVQPTLFLLCLRVSTRSFLLPLTRHRRYRPALIPIRAPRQISLPTSCSPRQRFGLRDEFRICLLDGYCLHRILSFPFIRSSMSRCSSF